MRRVILALVLLVASATAQNIRYDGAVAGPRGPVPFASVAACTQPATTTTQPCSPLASLCSSLTDVTCSQPNPVTSDFLGNFFFYIPKTALPFTLQVFGQQVSTPYVQADQGSTVTGGGSSVTGNGTAGVLALWTGTTALGNSHFSESGSVLTGTQTAIILTSMTLDPGIQLTDSPTGTCPTAVNANIPLYTTGGFSGCRSLLGVNNYNGTTSTALITGGLFLAQQVGTTAPAWAVGAAGVAYDSNGATAIGLVGEAYKDNLGGATSALQGVQAVALNSSSGTLTTVEGLAAQTGGAASSTTTNDWTIHIKAPVAPSTLANHAGLKIETQGTGTAITTGTDPVSFGGVVSAPNLNNYPQGCVATSCGATCSCTFAHTYTSITSAICNGDGGSCNVASKSTSGVTCNASVSTCEVLAVGVY